MKYKKSGSCGERSTRQSGWTIVSLTPLSFNIELEFDGDLTPEQRDKLLLAARACPVRRSLSKGIRFESLPFAQKT
jgi:uncharacterized OsmC-like protein